MCLYMAVLLLFNISSYVHIQMLYLHRHADPHVQVKDERLLEPLCSYVIHPSVCAFCW